jgi:hypothetical protein
MHAARNGEVINFKDPKLGDRLMRLISTAVVLMRIDQVLADADEQRSARPVVRRGAVGIGGEGGDAELAPPAAKGGS